MSDRRNRRRLAAGALVAATCLGCSPDASPVRTAEQAETSTSPKAPEERPEPPRGRVTLAFAGDMHFQLHLAALLERPAGALGPISRTLRAADVTMVNLESAITERGTPEAKELELPSERYYFRTSPAALEVLDAAGVDVATMANNHGVDYGPVGLADSLRAIRRGPVPVVGIGKDRRAAFAPYRVTVRGTDLAFLAGDASFREGASSVWSAGESTPGIAAAHADRPRVLVAAVRAAARHADIVVVYMHWGTEGRACPDPRQRSIARALAKAGADVVVGTHAHVLQGAGWIDDTYVGYGLGNFLWYHNRLPSAGVLEVEVRNGEVVGDTWVPARLRFLGRPFPLSGRERTAAVRDWERLRGCTGLAARPAA